MSLLDAAGSLEDLAAELATWLAAWATRDDSKPQPAATRAGHHAVGAIDDMLRELYDARARLITEIRTAQDAADARVDELLSRAPEPPGSPG